MGKLQNKPKTLVPKMGVASRPAMITPVHSKPKAKILAGTPPSFKPIPKHTPSPKLPLASNLKQTISTQRPIVMFDAAKNTFSNSPNFEIQKSQSYELTPAMLQQQSTRIQLPLTPAFIPQLDNNLKTNNVKRNTIVPEFQSMPQSVSRISTEGGIATEPKITQGFQPDPMPIPASTKLPVVDLMGHSVEELAAVANVSVEVIQAAINMRQQELLAQKHSIAYQQIMASQATTLSTTTTTTLAPSTTRTTKRPPIGGGNKVERLLILK